MRKASGVQNQTFYQKIGRALLGDNAMHFRLEPILHPGTGDILGYELLAGKQACPRWTSAEWSRWYASFPDWIHKIFSTIPASCWLSVNFSSAQISSDSAYATALALANQYRERVVIEWLENNDTEVDLSLVIRRLLSLRKLGAQLAIDDLGSVTGMDGLGRARLSKAEFVKLDGTFFHSFRNCAGHLRRLVQTMQALGHICILEWVETEEDQEIAMTSGATGVQGRRFSSQILHGHAVSSMGAYACTISAEFQ